MCRESQKTRWLERAIEELKHSKNWVLPALKQIRDICCLYQESPPNLAAGPGQRTPGVLYRHEVINKLQTSHALVILVADNLTNYMDEVRQSPRKILESDPLDYFPDGRYNHLQQASNSLRKGNLKNIRFSNMLLPSNLQHRFKSACRSSAFC